MKHYIELAGQKHPLCFSLAASEQLADEFGGLEQMQERLLGDSVSEGDKIRAIDRVLTVLMEAGRVYASASGEELPPKLPCRPVDLIDAGDPSALMAILSTIGGDTERTVETESKNGEATRAD